MKILLADDHPLFREGVKPVLKKLDAKPRIIEARDYPSAFEVTHQERELDLALMDLFMPGMQGVEGISRYRATFPDIPVVVVSASEQMDDIQALLAAGIQGYINKSAPSQVILGALRLVLTGGLYLPPNLTDPPESETAEPVIPRRGGRGKVLTTRQVQVLRQLAAGKTNRQIAESLQVSEGTVKIHMAAIFRVLKVNNRTEALLVAQKMGLNVRA